MRYEDTVKDGLVCWKCWMPRAEDDGWHDSKRGEDGCLMGRLGHRILWAAWGLEKGRLKDVIHGEFKDEH